LFLLVRPYTYESRQLLQNALTALGLFVEYSFWCCLLRPQWFDIMHYLKDYMNVVCFYYLLLHG